MNFINDSGFVQQRFSLLYEALAFHGIPIPKRIFNIGFTRWGKNNRYWACPIYDVGFVFGDFVDGLSKRVFQKNDYSPEKLELAKAMVETQRREAQKLLERQQEEVAERADTIFQAASIVEGNNHDYLKSKNASSYDLRISRTGSLIIPLRDIYNKLWSLQFIDTNGNKRFLAGSRTKGCFFTIGKFKKRILLCEGYATGNSIHKATGEQIIICFYAGNLKSVALEIKAKYQEAETIICADNDIYGPINNGLNKAIEAGNAVGARIVFPIFKDFSTKPTDFCDLQNLESPETVYEQVSQAFKIASN
jgi:putative DNA primase/helicase